MKKKYIVQFSGRESGAIGIFHSVTNVYMAESIEDAKEQCLHDRTYELNYFKYIGSEDEKERHWPSIWKPGDDD